MAIRDGGFKGAELRALRAAKGWSQAELGRRIGAHTTSISDWERGDNAPSGRHVAGLARELNVSAEHFYGTPESPGSAVDPMTEVENGLREIIREEIREELADEATGHADEKTRSAA